MDPLMADTVSQIPDARTRKTLAVILQRVADVGGEAIGRELGIDPSGVSRMKKEDFQRIARLLTDLGLKPVPVAAKLVDPEEYAQLKKWAIRTLEMPNADDDTGLHWGGQ